MTVNIKTQKKINSQDNHKNDFLDSENFGNSYRKDIFILTSFKDSHYGMALMDDLVSSNISCFILNEISKEGIDQYFDRFKILLIILSKNHKFEQYKSQLFCSTNNKKPVIFLKIDDYKPENELGNFFNKDNWIDVSNKDHSSCKQRIIFWIQEFLFKKILPIEIRMKIQAQNLNDYCAIQKLFSDIIDYCPIDKYYECLGLLNYVGNGISWVKKYRN